MILIVLYYRYFQVKEERKKKKKEEIKKEEKIDKLLDFDMLRDDVQFGERVDRPPIFTKLPKIKNRTMSQQRQFESVQLHYKQSKQLKKDKILQKIKSKDEETPSSFL